MPACKLNVCVNVYMLQALTHTLMFCVCTPGAKAASALICMSDPAFAVETAPWSGPTRGDGCHSIAFFCLACPASVLPTLKLSLG